MSVYYISKKDQPSDELYHYGILGMKWYIRRYQNPDGTYTALGKKRLHDARTGELTKRGQRYERDRDKYLAKQAEKEKKKQEARAATEKTFEEMKKAAIMNGDFQYAMNHFSEFSSEEMNSVIARYGQKKTLMNYKAESINGKMAQVEKFLTNSGKILTAGVNAYNIYAHVYNARHQDDFNKEDGETEKDSKKKKKSKSDDKIKPKPIINLNGGNNNNNNSGKKNNNGGNNLSKDQKNKVWDLYDKKHKSIESIVKEVQGVTAETIEQYVKAREETEKAKQNS